MDGSNTNFTDIIPKAYVLKGICKTYNSEYGGVDSAYHEYFVSDNMTPTEIFTNYIVNSFISTGRVKSLDEVSTYDIMNVAFPDYYRNEPPDYIIYDMLKPVFLDVGFILKIIRRVSIGENGSYIYVNNYDDLCAFDNWFKQKYPELNSNDFYDLNDCKGTTDFLGTPGYYIKIIESS